MGISNAKLVENIDNWISLLQKGDLRQEKNVLKRIVHVDDGDSVCLLHEVPKGVTTATFCCLGVAGEFVLKLPHERNISGSISFWQKGATEDGTNSSLPGSSYRSVGLWDDSGQRYDDNGNIVKLKFTRNHRPRVSKALSLAEYNDSGFTFKQIAERMLVDLRTDAFGFFTPGARKAWRKHHKFIE